VNNLRKRLDDVKKTLPDPLSPIPSPTLDAPSPAESPVDENVDNIEPVDMELSSSDDEGYCLMPTVIVRAHSSLRKICKFCGPVCKIPWLTAAFRL